MVDEALGAEHRMLLEWFEAARSGDEAKIRAMMEEGMWTEAKSPGDGETALMLASGEGHLGCVLALLEECSVDERDEWGNTALLIASARGRAETARALLAAGADPSAANRSGLGVEGAKARFEARASRREGL